MVIIIYLKMKKWNNVQQVSNDIAQTPKTYKFCDLVWFTWADFFAYT